MVVKYLEENGFEFKDLGPYEIKSDDDYPDYALPFAQKVAEEHERGVILCGNAEGVCIASNKVDGIRAALGYSAEAARTSRSDDASNVLCLPGRLLEDDLIIEILDTWLKTEFSGDERHVRRINKIKQIEKNN